METLIVIVCGLNFISFSTVASKQHAGGMEKKQKAISSVRGAAAWYEIQLPTTKGLCKNNGGQV
jgi:hypothetical protein